MTTSDADTRRLDWLADPANYIGNVTLPAECVKRNLHCLRAAIDDAMAGVGFASAGDARPQPAKPSPLARVLSASELASMLVKCGLVNEDAVVDPEGYDNSISLAAIAIVTDRINSKLRA